MTVAGMLLEGCGNKEERAEKVKAALEEKYGGEFEVMRVMGQGVMEDYFVAEAYNDVGVKSPQFCCLAHC